MSALTDVPASTASIPVPKKLLQFPADWQEWFDLLSDYSKARKIWDNLNPDQAEQETDSFSAPLHPTMERTKALFPDYKKEDATITLNMLHESLYKDYVIERSNHLRKENHACAIRTWISSSVDPSIYKATRIDLEKENPDFTLRQLIKALKSQLAPAQSSVREESRRFYNASLKEARRANQSAEQWYLGWSKAYTRACIDDINEIKGTNAIRDFLNAVGARFEPSWARTMLDSIIVNEARGVEETRTLREFANMFNAINSAHKSDKQSGNGVFTTFGGHSDQNKQADKNNNGNAPKGADVCPCNFAHQRWEASACRRLRYAITGDKEVKLRKYPTKEEVNRIKSRYNNEKWKDLRAKIAADGWGEGSRAAEDLYPASGGLNATIIDPKIVQSVEQHFGIYTALGKIKHPLSLSTLLDNCGALHLVNDVNLLQPGSFKETKGEYVEAGTTTFPIIGRGTRVLKKILNGKRGARTEDLVLNDVAVIEDFHVNVVSASSLRAKGAWVCGYDDTLRFGSIQESVVLASLLRKFNITFLEYKPLDNYIEDSQGNVVISSAPTIIAASPHAHDTHTQSSQRWRPSKDPPKPREDTPELWHLRAGHLGQAALEKLHLHTRNVRIRGIKRKDCETCAQVTARQVISRRPREHVSPRPFWRVHWDLQDYQPSYNGMKWLLVFKDEYTKMIQVHPLPNKAQDTVFNALIYFERWVARQFGLSICKFMQDNESAVIGRAKDSIFQSWARAQGIELENSPPYTHESNGGIERAGQAITQRSNAMLTGARLPTNLWSESTQAAAYLHNISPSQLMGWKSPTETLEAWFRDNARLPIRELTADLRPDWDGVYAYGCRAYPLERDREAGRNRRYYKTSPRGHIGYLVGYSASNIYRIWIPRLDKVMTTRNVTFNESVFYDPRTESVDELPVAELEAQFQAIQVNDELDDEINLLPAITEDSLAESAPVALSNSGVEAQPIIQDKDSSVQELETRTGLQTPRQTPDYTSDGGTADAATGLEQPTSTSEAQPSTGPALPQIQKTVRFEDEAQVIDIPGDDQDEQRTPVPEAHQADDELATRSDAQPEALVTTESSTVGDDPEPESSQDAGATRRSTRLAGKERQDWSVLRKKRPDLHLINFVEYMWEQPQGRILPDQQDIDVDAAQSVVTVFAVIDAFCNRLNRAHINQRLKLTDIHQSQLMKKPGSWREMLNHPLRAQWEEAMLREVTTLRGRRTWKEIKRANAITRPLPLKWVFDYKFDEKGYLTRCKARICVRGDLQERSTIERTYAATLAAHAFRLMMALAARYDMEMRQYDIKNAFLYAVRNEHETPVTCELPDGYKLPGMCVELLRALYGLRDSPNLWFEELSATLRKAGLTSSKEEPCIFYDEARDVYLIFFVDDMIMIHHKTEKARRAADSLEECLKQAYDLEEKGEPSFFLGIQIIRDRKNRKIYLSHEAYINKISEKFGQAQKGTFPAIPIPTTELVVRIGEATKLEIKIYQEKVGSVLYTAIMIRPDVAYAASKLSQFLTNPGPEHQKAVDQAIRYLTVTSKVALCYGGTGEIRALEVASDASYADDVRTRKSSQGYIVMLFGGPIIWKATRQSTVTTSTTEAELLALQQTAKEVMALKRLFRDIKFDPQEEYNIKCDNQQTIRLVDQAIRYLTVTSKVALCYGGTGEIRALEVASDASYADDVRTRKSSQGYIVMLFGGPIIWKATRQSTVTTSTTEAELLALQQTAKEVMALKRLFRDIKFDPQEEYNIKCDNQQTIRLVLNSSERINTRLRHVDIHNMWLKQEYEKGSFEVTYLPTAEMPADGFTKALTRQRFEHFRGLLNLVDLRTQGEITQLHNHANEDTAEGGQ